MFERFSEKARRSIFFAKYEASNMGSPYLEPEHLLLGLLREDKALTQRLLDSYAAVDSMRKKIQASQTVGEKGVAAKNPASSDAPLSRESKRVLANAAMEADNRSQSVDTAHIFLGLLHHEKSFATELLREHGLSLASVREQLQNSNLLPPHNGQRPPFTFTLKAVSPRLGKANLANPSGFHEGPDGIETRLTNPALSRMVTCENMTMTEFAESLPRIAPGYIRGGHVIDATGLDGAWDFTLSFSIATRWKTPGKITLFEAIEDQQGLRLEKIADSAEPPQA